MASIIGLITGSKVCIEAVHDKAQTHSKRELTEFYRTKWGCIIGKFLAGRIRSAVDRALLLIAREARICQKSCAESPPFKTQFKTWLNLNRKNATTRSKSLFMCTYIRSLTKSLHEDLARTSASKEVKQILKRAFEQEIKTTPLKIPRIRYFSSPWHLDTIFWAPKQGFTTMQLLVPAHRKFEIPDSQSTREGTFIKNFLATQPA